MVERYYDRGGGQDVPFRCDGFQRGGLIPIPGGGGLALADLPPFLRALLVTDGTVTKILEAYFWEPVAVDTLTQDLRSAERDIPWVEVAAGDQVLVRQAQLRGTDSDKVYASALSVIRTELIPPTFRQRLIDREIGIGVLIRDSGLESYRELMEVGVGDAQEDAAGGVERIFRTYRIIIARAPVILITETFPLALYLATRTGRDSRGEADSRGPG
jgi:chorismate-pyruvate lyase